MVETPVLSARGVVKCYNDGRHPIEVLSGLNLTVMSGDWLAIVGASGSGKSTLLNLLGGLDAPDAGEVVVSGRLLTDMSERERSLWRNQNLGFVFQMHHLLPEFSALENVAMPARIGGVYKDRCRRTSSTSAGSIELVGASDSSTCSAVWRRAPASRYCASADK